MKKLLTLLLSTTLVTACGWHLRGSLLLPADLKSLYITAKDSHGNLVSDIKKLVQGYDINLANKRSDAQYSLIILQERDERRTISVGNDALASEYEITLAADYRIESNDKIVVPIATATVSRSYDHDPDDVLSKSEEELLLRNEMRLDLIQQIIRRLSFATTNQTAPAAEATPAG